MITLDELIDQRHPLGVAIQVSNFMVGMRKAVWDGATLTVSPSMMSLLRDEDSVELAAKHIDVVYIPRIDFSMPMTSVEW